jgi:hypothetical protein
MLITETNNVFCNKITPPEFTTEQIAKCKGNKAQNIPSCRHASGRGRWCGHFGCWIEEGRIIQPNGKVKTPAIKQKKPCNEKEFEVDYEKAKGMYAGYIPMGREVIDLITKVEYIERRAQCVICPDKNNCPVRGCFFREQVIHRKWKCPKNK